MAKAWMNDLDIEPGDHVIAIITNEDEAKLIGQFVAEAVERDEPCSVIAASSKLPALQEGAAGEGVDVSSAVEGNKLSFVDPVPIGTEGDEFDIELFLERMAGAAAQIKASGVKHARNCGAMDWLRDVTNDMNDAVMLEARLNELYEDHPISGF